MKLLSLIALVATLTITGCELPADNYGSYKPNWQYYQMQGEAIDSIDCNYLYVEDGCLFSVSPGNYHRSVGCGTFRIIRNR